MFILTFRHSLTFLLFILLISVEARAQSTAFTYQGNLRDGGNPANGSYDLQFKLFDTFMVGTGTQQGSTVTASSISVTGGIFTVNLDFGASVFTGASRYLEIGVRPAGNTDPYVVLSPRQMLSSSPYAIHTLSATAADSLSAACIGCVADAHIQSIDGAKITGSIAGSQISGTVPVNSVPTGSENYIQNAAAALRQGKTALQQAAGFEIDGDGIAGGMLSGNIVNATAQFNLGGLRMLSNPGQRNLFAGEGAGESNSGDGSNAFFGYHAGMNNTSGVRNNFFGSVTGESTTTGTDNNFFGDSAGRFNTSGSQNSFFGSNAGMNNSTASGNSFFGFNSGRDNTTGFGNAFFGYFAGSSNTRGNQNSFLGYLAGTSNTTGSNNSFFGIGAGFTNGTGSDNAYFGYHTGFHSLGNANTFIGSDAGFENSTGHDNTFVGSTAGSQNLSGSFNTMIGANTDFEPGLVTFATAIGSGARVSQSNSIVLGRQINQTSADSVGIGTPNPARTLDVNGRARVRNIPLEASTATVCFNAAGDLLQCGASSLRWKRNVQPFRSGVEVIRRLRPISFIWKEDGREDFGLGAEEVAKVAPNLVFTNKAGEVEGVKYEKLNLLLINVVKEQQTQISQLQRQISEQSQQLKQQQNQIKMMKKLLCLDPSYASLCR